MVTQHKLLKKPERDTQNNMPVALKKIKLGFQKIINLIKLIECKIRQRFMK